MNRIRRAPRTLAPLALRAGPVALRFEPASLWIRDLRCGEAELVRAVYPAVRDTTWSTAEPDVAWIRREVCPRRFALALRATYGGTRPFFAWDLSLAGGPDGTVDFVATGTVLRAFATNRTGFCVLHPAELAGRPCTLEHTDGYRERARFPRAISPHQPFRNLRAIRHRVAGVGLVEVQLEGDTFETEDQRNWTDASFKTYSRPLALPFPYTLKPGDLVHQRVRVSLAGRPTVRAARASVAPLRFGPIRARRPAIGLGLTGDGPLPPHLPVNHLRIEIDTGNRSAVSAWKRAQMAMAPLPADKGLEIALLARPDDTALEPLARAVAVSSPVRPLRWLVIDRKGRPVSSHLLKTIERLWERHGVIGEIGCGVAGDFVELNRTPPSCAKTAFVSFRIDAQVHAFDDASILETLTIHPTTLRQARRLAGGRPVIVSPSTLGTPRRPGFDARAGDPRRFKPLAAVWTLGCLAAAISGGARAVTFHGTHGPDGILPAGRSARSPVLDLLAAWHSFPARRVSALPADARRTAVGVALQGQEHIRVLVGNLRAEPQTVRLAGLPRRRPHSTLVCGPLKRSESVRRSGDLLALGLPGHAVLQLDFPAS